MDPRDDIEMVPDPAGKPMASPEPPDARADDFMAYRHARPREPIMLPNGSRAWAVGLTALEKDEWYHSCKKTADERGIERITDPFSDAKLVVRSVRNSKGALLFGDTDLPRILEWPPVLLAPIVDKCIRVSAIGGRADEAILKNLAASLNLGS